MIGRRRAMMRKIMKLAQLIMYTILFSLLIALMVAAVNQAPSAAGVKVLPENATAGQDLLCNYTYSDPEGFEEQESTIEWWKNSVNQNINAQLLGKLNLTPNDPWYCKVTPSDGLLNGTQIQSSNTVKIRSTIQNPILYVNGAQAWNSPGYFAEQQTAGFEQGLRDALNSCTPDVEGFCDINLTFGSDAAGLLNITEMEVFYEVPPVYNITFDNLSLLYTEGTIGLYDIRLLNNGDSELLNLNWSIDFGDGNITQSNYNFDLSANEDIFLFAEHNYSSPGIYTVTVNASAGSVSDSISDVFNIGNVTDVNKFTIKNTSGSSIAWFGDSGNAVIKGALEQNSAHARSTDFAFVIRNNGEDVLIIENDGNMYIDGTLFQNQSTISSSLDDTDFRIRKDGEWQIVVNESGHVFLKGMLTQNGNP
ncbi:MAG TPA: hypothetical protein VJK03_00285 [Candidatus Nanoarchaeia archaeon]|nr:hypothetical protein [Candidatus Nanoarchaeia archaeon]